MFWDRYSHPSPCAYPGGDCVCPRYAITAEEAASPTGVDAEPRPDGFAHIWYAEEARWVSLGYRPAGIDEEEAAFASSPAEVLANLREGTDHGAGVYAVPCGGRQTYYTVTRTPDPDPDPDPDDGCEVCYLAGGYCGMCDGRVW